MKILVLAAALLVSGCLCCREGVDYFQVRVGNRADVELQSVVVDADGLRGGFGYLGGSPHAEKTAGFCPVRFTTGFAIEWQEDGQVKRTAVDLKRYEARKREIKSFGFYYMGSNRWDVIARKGENADSEIVLPE